MSDEEFLKLCRQKNNAGYNNIKEYIDNKGKFKSIKGKADTTPLHIAVRNNNNLVVQLLIDNGFNPMMTDKTNRKKTPIVDAIEVSNIEGALIILNSSNIKPLNTKGRYNEYTALALNKSIDDINFGILLQKLLDIGLNIDYLDNVKNNILNRSVLQNNLNRVELCVASGADINNPFINIIQHAFYAENHNNVMIHYLIDNGAILFNNSENLWESYNALEWAHSTNNVEMFESLLLKYNALDNLSDQTLEDIISYKEIPFLKLLWEIPLVHEFIILHNLEDAFPKTIRDVFVF